MKRQIVVSVTVPEELLDQLDQARGLVSRSAVFRQLARDFLSWDEENKRDLLAREVSRYGG